MMNSRTHRRVSRIELTNLTPIPFRLSLESIPAPATSHSGEPTPKTYLIISPIPFKLSFDPCLKGRPFSSDKRAASLAADFPPLSQCGSEKTKTINVPHKRSACDGAPRFKLPSEKQPVTTDLPSPSPSPTTNVGHVLKLKGSETSVRSAMKPTGVIKPTSAGHKSRKRRKRRAPKKKKEASTPQRGGGVDNVVGSAMSGATSGKSETSGRW